jgi:acyl-coenzyme A synthetase/AMP-(fatty) acid ligase
MTDFPLPFRHDPCPADFNAAAHVLKAGEATPDKIALLIMSQTRAERWSYARMSAAVRGCGTGLLAKGLQPGDQVMLRLSNTAAFPVAFLGAIAVGLIPVPVSAQLTEAEVAALMVRIRSRLIVADPALPLPACGVPVLSAADVLRMDELPPCDWALGEPDRPAYAICTSGTSGHPKVVLHAHRAVWARRMMHQGWEGIDQADRVLHAGAMNWTFTLGTGLLDPWTVGATSLVPAPGVTPDQLPLMLRRHDVTVFAAAPGVIRQMLRAPMPPLPRLRHGLCAGETLQPALRRAWTAATGTDLHEALGMTECSTYLSGSPLRPAPEGHVGFPQHGRNIALFSGDRISGTGEEGEIAIHRGDPGLMLGYLDDANATAERFRGEWFLTGDRATVSAEGAFRYLGRTDDLMNAGGYRVAPLEIEAELAGVEGVEGVAALEAELRPGARVIVCLYCADADKASSLKARAEQVLARYKQPRDYRRVNSLPRTANGKLDRRNLLRIWKATT